MDYEPLGESDAAFAPIGSIHGDFHGISITFPRRQFESTQEIARESPFSMFQ